MRRQFFTNTIKIVAVGVGAFSIFKLNDTPKSESKIELKKGFFLRPPGVKNEKHFLANCIRCAKCVKACPYHTLSLASANDVASNGTPKFVAKEIPCYLCDGLPCIKACPTDALDKSINKISLVNIGRAIVDESSCVAHFGIQCDACYRACPFIDKALRLEYKRNERTQKHAMLVPKVDYDYCVGCGLCEKVCITKKPAIVILPTSFILGERNDNYVKGWVSGDDERLKNIDTSKKHDDKKAINYLNDGDF
ncbi:ferredoxin-type protein NapG [Campylobacter sp. Cr9]|uniref:ferredoxin-type protein NapG n=1 Tax=Campylobacter sp. Cr9 TaxID=2735728 RepID=UPI003015629F|nr:ferredoxin-type protein NapG [Campylobacter sp. Cr9]